MNTKMTPGKRILSVLLTVIMVMSTMPMSVFAADEAVAEVTIGSTTTQYSDLAQAFYTAQYQTATVKLLKNVDAVKGLNGFLYYGIELSQAGSVTLDLNGCSIEKYNSTSGSDNNRNAFFYVTGNAKLTITDSIGGGEIIQPVDAPAIIVDKNASLTVEGGIINASYDAGIYVGGGTVTVTGGPEIHSENSNALLITGESTVTLSGGTYTTNEKNKSCILTTVGKVTDLLGEGFRYTDVNGLDVAITEDGQGTDSDYVTVSDFGIKYIDADGAVLNLQNTLYMFGGSVLNIYGQSGGTGTLTAIVTSGEAAIGIVSTATGGTVAVNVYGGTVTAQASYGAQPIGINPRIMQATVNVTIAKGLKCVKTDDPNTAYAYDNTDCTSITITKCTDHKWSYVNITDDTHDQTCDLCGTTETGVKHATARYTYIRREATKHHLICACGKEYGTEYHTYTMLPTATV